MITKNLEFRIQARIGQLSKEFQRKGFISDKEIFDLKVKATKVVRELEDSLVLEYLINSSKSSCSVVSTRDAGTVPLFHGKVTD
jgi:hypothetical protein